MHRRLGVVPCGRGPRRAAVRDQQGRPRRTADDRRQGQGWQGQGRQGQGRQGEGRQGEGRQGIGSHVGSQVLREARQGRPRRAPGERRLADPQAACHAHDRADNVFAKESPCLVAVDASGEWCDALGVWKRPVNIVIDKTGAVRFAGLTDDGLKAKLPELVAEEADESIEAREKPPAPGSAATKTVEEAKWPEFLAPVNGATDLRTKPFPGLGSVKWVTARPEQATRLLAIDFWFTGCQPCRNAIPHLNEMAEKWGKDVLFVGLSAEKESVFNDGVKRYKLKLNEFSYALALDTGKKGTTAFFGVNSFPNMAIISPDGIVRWQGDPRALQPDELDKMIAANRAANSKAAAPAKGARGWAASGAGQKSR
ncbi:MAG: TlpA family protein disulfide reductase [Proteobacteria bacterium]|nr:TlpA family protein disulfide reductase [Pseudomonadota bacterium]